MKPNEPPKEVQVPDFRAGSGRRWKRCDECKEQTLIEVNGKTYYHRLKCSRSNGVRYGKDRL